eukprot:TRINITY_DN778211_c0_g1_i1.p1 TRINITY_DN778211_c0_g1~~TRINITY_DN778211_c0_g1_i1.p1  ORF type:complete len:253 (+),score=59.26 TRINITY_DN778211_c0_g1_i1:147-905(+)
MGLCKVCRKVTRFYCYNNKHHICQKCVDDCKNHHIDTYREWVQSPEFDVDERCEICMKTINVDDQSVRLRCMKHLFHENCISEYLSSLPETTTPNGFSCPVCNETLWNEDGMSPSLKEFIEKQEWCERAKPIEPNSPIAETPVPEKSDDKFSSISTPAGRQERSPSIASIDDHHNIVVTTVSDYEDPVFDEKGSVEVPVDSWSGPLLPIHRKKITNNRPRLSQTHIGGILGCIFILSIIIWMLLSAMNKGTK